VIPVVPAIHVVTYQRQRVALSLNWPTHSVNLSHDCHLSAIDNPHDRDSRVSRIGGISDETRCRTPTGFTRWIGRDARFTAELAYEAHEGEANKPIPSFFETRHVLSRGSRWNRPWDGYGGTLMKRCCLSAIGAVLSLLCLSGT